MNEAKKIKINFKMPPESAADRAHRLHQQIRKKSGLPDPEEYKRRAAEKQREIDAMKEAAAIPVGQHDQSISNKARSQKSSAETRARAMGAAAATRSKNAALRDVIKEPERDVREAALTHYVKVNNALKTTPSGAHVMKFPDKESAQRHANEHKRRNPNHQVTVTTNANDSTPVWHGGTRTREYAMREGIDMEQQHEEMHRIGLTVTDPNHPMVSKRKETIQKTIRIKGDDREKAINGAIAHYKRKGYKVHDHHYMGTVNEAKDTREYDYEGDMAKKIAGATVHKEEVEVQEVNDYFKRRQREKDVDAGKPVKPPPKNPPNDYFARRKKEKELGEAKEKTEYDYEGDMAKSQLRAIIANAQQVHDMLEDNTNMAEWVQSKITLAADYISTVADYMQAEVKEETELEEAIKLGSKVMIHAPGKSYHGKTGQVGEIRNGAFKGAPKTYTVDHDDGSIQLSQKNVKLHKEDLDIDEAAWGQDKMANLRAAHDRHSEKAIKANKAGDHEAVKVHQRKMGLIKTQMNKLRTEDLDESINDHIEQSLAAKDINAKVEGDKVHVHPDNLSKARYTLDKMGVKHSVHGTLKDSVEYCHWEIVTEGWSQGNRNPQRGIKVGDKVRSYDFPGMHDDHYVEGHVVRDTPSSYHLRVNKVVRSGKEIPVPAHMAHVEAPKGKGLFSDAYGVHKIMAKQQSVSATQEPVMGAQKTFAKVRGR